MLKKTLTAPIVVLLLSAVTLGFQIPSDWTSFNSPEGRFSIVMPQKPEEQVKDVESAVGTLKLHTFPASDAAAFYLLTYGDYPTEPTADRREAVLDGVRGGVVTGMKAELVSEVKITIDGYPGREFIIKKKSEAGEQIFTWRVYLVGRRLYQMAGSPKNLNSSVPEIQKFLNSFRLTN